MQATLMDCEKNKYLLPTANKPLIYLRFLKFYNYTRTQKPFMPYPGVSGFFDAEGRGLEQDGAPQCAKNAEIRHFLVRGKVPSA